MTRDQKKQLLRLSMWTVYCHLNDVLKSFDAKDARPVSEQTRETIGAARDTLRTQSADAPYGSWNWNHVNDSWKRAKPAVDAAAGKLREERLSRQARHLEGIVKEAARNVADYGDEFSDDQSGFGF